MNGTVPATQAPYPLPTFQDDGEVTNANLLTYIGNLSDALEVNSHQRFDNNELLLWINTLNVLNAHFLNAFPLPGGLQWDALHERIRLTQDTLQLLRRALPYIADALCIREGVATLLFLRLLNLCYVLDIWLDVPTAPADNGCFSPLELRQLAIETCTSLLQILCNSLKQDSSDNQTMTQVGPEEKFSKAGWQIAKSMLSECLEACSDVASDAAVPDNVRWQIFSNTRWVALDSVDGSSDVAIEVERTSHQPLLVTTIVEVMLRTFSAPLLSQCFLVECFTSLVSVTCKLYRYLLSPSCQTSSTRRARAIARLVASATACFHSREDVANISESMRLHLLLSRLQDGPDEEWDRYDLLLEETFAVPVITTLSAIDMQTIVIALTNDAWGARGQTLRRLCCVYMRPIIGKLTVDLLREVDMNLSRSPYGQEIAELKQLIQAQLADLMAVATVKTQKVEDAPQMASWRAETKELVEVLVKPYQLDWMDEDEGSSDEQFRARALAEIDNRFESPLQDRSAGGRLSLANYLSRLPCALSGHSSSSCRTMSTTVIVDSIQACLRVALIVAGGSNEEVTMPVRKAVHDALAKIIVHHPRGASLGRLDHIGELCIRDMKSVERSVRLSAGRCTTELIKLWLEAASLPQIEASLKAISTILRAENDRVRETALITVGSIAKVAEGNLLSTTLLLLFEFVGHASPVLSGIAYMQLCAVAKSHKKSHFSLLSPFMDLIAPFLVGRIVEQEKAILETCRFVSFSENVFLNGTLGHTLPTLFAERNEKALKKVATWTKSSVHSLFLGHHSKILAHAFLKSRPGQTTAILNFIVNILNAASGNAAEPVNNKSVVASRLVDVITELVVMMGDEDTSVATTARQGLMRVYEIARDNEGHASSDQEVKVLLKTYMLGVITQLNDVLQRGKQSVQGKRRIIRSLAAFVRIIGRSVSRIAPQVMATLQTTVSISELAEVTLQSWLAFLRALKVADIAQHIGPTSASLATLWPTFDAPSRALAVKCFDFIVIQNGDILCDSLDEIGDLSSIPELTAIAQHLQRLQGNLGPAKKLKSLLTRVTSDSAVVALRALHELKAFLVMDNEAFIRGMASGDAFSPLLGQTLAALLSATSRDNDGSDSLWMVAFECIGILGAVDPDRVEMPVEEKRMIVTSNFTDVEESQTFAMHLLKEVLVGNFRSTTDLTYQGQLAYCIQKLATFCGFTPDLVTPGAKAVQLKVRRRWDQLPKDVVETLTPLLGSNLTFTPGDAVPTERPIYPSKGTYREWIETWTSCLISQTSGENARRIFSVFPHVVHSKDILVARHILPHVLVNILISGEEAHVQDIRSELLAVLNDQVDATSTSTADKRDLSAQTVFMLMDHVNKWVRSVRQELNATKASSKRTRLSDTDLENQLVRVDSVLSSINQKLIADAALRCRAYARALMSFEQLVLSQRDVGQNDQLPEYYENLHEIYAQLEEPDGMEGISTLILSPSLEHQIRQHESTGRWTSAQSCWEVQLQRSPDEIKSHLGLLRCLKNLGHYDTLRTHVEGVLTRRPEWLPELVQYQMESACMVGSWQEVESLLSRVDDESSSTLIARVLLAMRKGDEQAIRDAVMKARRKLGSPITAAGLKGYRRSYEAVLDLHLLRELEVINESILAAPSSDVHARLSLLHKQLDARMESTTPSFRIREPILSVRRTAFGLRSLTSACLTTAIGKSWLHSAKLARKDGYWQTAYSAVLQSQQRAAPFAFIESTKLTRAIGEPLRALQELENSLGLTDSNGIPAASSATTDTDTQQLYAKALLLRGKWMRDSDRFEASEVLKVFQKASDFRKDWESGFFHLGQFQDESFKRLSLLPADQSTYDRGMKMKLSTIRFFTQAIIHGNKYIYQTLPRVLTLWLDMGDKGANESKDKATMTRATAEISRIYDAVPVYKWYTAFPQLVSRIGQPNSNAFRALSKIIVRVLKAYPRQALWLFASIMNLKKKEDSKEKKESREKKEAKEKKESERQINGAKIMQTIQNDSDTSTQHLIRSMVDMTETLLAVCNFNVGDTTLAMSMQAHFPKLKKMAPSRVIIPLQDSLTASLPPTAEQQSTHQPFPVNPPTFQEFFDEIDIMRSLARPRKITMRGSDGNIYITMAKPKDDLRKDARLMDFNDMINKFLLANSESRKRHLRIRTYGVVTLDSSCGLVEWVPNTIPVRTVLTKLYKNRGLTAVPDGYGQLFTSIKQAKESDAVQIFCDKLLAVYRPVFHEWFIETFPEPSAWLASRMAYSRTAAVMSIVGFILGLGDRHCENILLDTNSGDAVHVDFSCLFEKGKLLEIPERVPFRLTQNLVDGLGVTGVDGVFRIACEITMDLLRENKDCLMNVLDAFIHDPLVEWEDEKRRRDAEAANAKGNVWKTKPLVDNPTTADLRALAMNALRPIEKKLEGIYSIGKEKQEKQISTSSLVQMLIAEATDLTHLAKMYVGWAAWH